jgi:hypothetical protein
MVGCCCHETSLEPGLFLIMTFEDSFLLHSFVIALDFYLIDLQQNKTKLNTQSGFSIPTLK